MARRTTVHGLKECDAALAELVKATNSRTGKAALKRGLLNAAEPMVTSAKTKAHKRSGELSDSIAAGASLENSVGKAAFAQAKRSGASDEDAVSAMRSAQRAAKGTASTVTVYVGPTGKAGKRAHLEEFGVKPHIIKPRRKKILAWPGGGGEGDTAFATQVQHPGAPAHPFMRPAFEDSADAVLNRLQPEVAKQIDQAAQRARRKATRAKG